MWFFIVPFIHCFLLSFDCISGGKEDDRGVKLPSKCETCKFVIMELADRFKETGRTHDVVVTSKGRVKKYTDSELRFVESLEGVCDRILSYNMHKEHENSERFAKGMSETMRTLHGLVEKGVKVDLGIPEELWDSPSVEVTRMKQECEQILGEYEDDLEEWFSKEKKAKKKSEIRASLQKFLCEDRVLKDEERGCLSEISNENIKGDRGEL